ncbi:GntR family transcriptional regulator [Rhodococcus sp. 1168]|uniref:GntR family transcriptional regulator n=1 Tax=Rhodococcus sp. 1168 TaxID=2018041 RepID=UPI000A0E99AC|nr:GntR family transcriptional regulator [Rhodococcus sp. 1168]ORI26556.1 GntR family transcriptional regulator [Rhodococcus sp. 1168]
MSMPADVADADHPQSLSASAIAYRAISEAILKGVYPEGQFLDEASLARSVGTSRTPVREALRRLHSERYVDLVPRRGAQVRVTTATEMHEIYETRLVIESAALVKICRQRRGAPSEAPSILDAMAVAGARSEWFEFARLDQRFHQSLVSHGGNGVLTELYSAMRPRHIRLSVRTITEAPHRREIIELEHSQIVDALDADDDKGAVRILNQHLMSVPELMHAFPH